MQEIQDIHEFNKENCIKCINNTLNRVKNMNDKVKSLLILDRYEDELDSKYFKYIYADEEVYKNYMELIWQWGEIRETLTEKEHDRYGNTLPKEMDELDWSKNTRELFEKRLKETGEYKLSIASIPVF